MTLDLTRLPRGQREWPAFVEELSHVDDRAERYFLELKSELDLTTRQGQAKVAKFILGAANRSPEQARRRFKGHALLVLGVSKGAVTGIAPFEAMDLGRTVQQFIGADGPSWDFERIPVDDARDVIVIIVDPPEPGDPIWTCRRDGPEGLRDGGIYLRADGETRETKGDEVRALVHRARQPRLDTDLSVSLAGVVTPYRYDAGLLDRFIRKHEERLFSAYTRAVTNADTKAWMKTEQERLLQALATPEERTYEQYVEAISDWGDEVRDAWPTMVHEVLGYVAPPAQVVLTNNSKTFLEGVEVQIHLAGEVFALHFADVEYANPLAKLPAAPRDWGPRIKSLGSPAIGSQFWASQSTPTIQTGGRDGAVSFRNGGSVDLQFTLRELRPEQTHKSDLDDFVLLIAEDLAAESVTGSWRVTARGHHDVFKGDLNLTLRTPLT